MAFAHQSRGRITFHFSVRLPLVVPAPEGFAVVFRTLLSTEVQAIRWTRLLVTELINTTGTLAEFTAVLGPTKENTKQLFCKTYFLCDWRVTRV